MTNFHIRSLLFSQFFDKRQFDEFSLKSSLVKFWRMKKRFQWKNLRSVKHLAIPFVRQIHTCHNSWKISMPALLIIWIWGVNKVENLLDTFKITFATSNKDVVIVQSRHDGFLHFLIRFSSFYVTTQFVLTNNFSSQIEKCFIKSKAKINFSIIFSCFKNTIFVRLFLKEIKKLFFYKVWLFWFNLLQN